MAGFDNNVVYGSNVDFSGSATVSGKMTTDGQILIGSTASPNIRVSLLTSSDGSISFTPGSGTLSIQGTPATAFQSGSVILATNAEAIAGVVTTKAITPDDLKAKLGTQTAHSLAVFEGSTLAVTALGAATNGQLPIGSTSANPVLSTLTAGTGISISNGAGTITISSSGGGSTWTEVTGTSQAMAIDNGYVANNGSLVTLTLPSTAAFGSYIRVTGKGTGGWRIAQNSGQRILFGTATTSTGVGGRLDSTATRDTVEILCVTANDDWNVLSSIGNITVT